MLIYDALTARIIAEIGLATLKKHVISSWRIAKIIYGNSVPRDLGKAMKKGYMVNKSLVIEKRIKNMVNEGLVGVEEKEEETIYTLTDRILLRRYKFPEGSKDMILIKRPDSQWVALQVIWELPTSL